MVPTTPAVWIVYTLAFGYPLEVPNHAAFTNKSACQIYLHMTYADTDIEAFNLKCATK